MKPETWVQLYPRLGEKERESVRLPSGRMTTVPFLLTLGVRTTVREFDSGMILVQRWRLVKDR